MTDPVGVSRRDFLRLGLAAGPASLVAACGWDGGSLLEPGLRGFSRINDWVGEKIFLTRSRLAKEYPASARTPERLFPAYSITFNQKRMYPDPPPGWQLEVNGLVQSPTRFTLEMLGGLPRVSYTVKHHCVEGWTAIGTWTGVPVSVVAELVRPLPEARYLRFDSFDSGYSNGWDLTSAMHPQTILAYAFNGRPLSRERGAPVRLYSPIKLGYKLTKYVTTMSFTSERHGGYWEDQGYPWLAGSNLLVPVGLTLGLVAARVAAAPAISDPLGQPLPPALRVIAPSSYVVLAPLYTLWDGVAMLSMSRLHGFLLGLALLYAAWRILRVVGGRRFDPRGEVGALVGALVALAAFVAGGLINHRPMAKLTRTEPDVAVVDFHSHTNASHDVRGTAMGRFDTEKNLAWHQRAGFDAVFVTDHNTTAGLVPTDVAVSLCRGLEVSAWRAHIVLLGGELDSVRGPYRENWPGLLQLLADADTVYGALSVASLPEYERNHWGRLDSLVDAGLDGFEIVNASPKANELTRARRDTVIDLARRTGKLVVGVSDHHGWGATSMVWSLVTVPGWREEPERLCAGIMSALERGFPAVTVVERHRLRPDDWWPNWLTPIAVLWETWRGMGWDMTLAWLAWIWALWMVGRTRYSDSS